MRKPKTLGHSFDLVLDYIIGHYDTAASLDQASVDAP
ncbi:hypothetical protein AXFE_18160 [Acidithrix ferrooxidans]|uniref:Uncharacterized protein n=1 Tax=Acidithrix ferrooxidans TaxID=1280514 RepID=A0A0D8HHM2_9ACTN|nr:hypothetical protein AXFE_18160 [Acidithrix ferrooxidans]